MYESVCICMCVCMFAHVRACVYVCKTKHVTCYSRRAQRLNVGLVENDSSLGQGINVGGDDIGIVEAHVIPTWRGVPSLILHTDMDKPDIF